MAWGVVQVWHLYPRGNDQLFTVPQPFELQTQQRPHERPRACSPTVMQELEEAAKKEQEAWVSGCIA